MRKKLFLMMITTAIVFSMVLCGSMMVFAYEGGGTDTDPYKIGNAADLNKMAEDVNSGVNVGKFFRLTADISKPADFKSIGTQENPFQGNFDGNSKSISGLTKPLFGVIEKRDGMTPVVESLLLKDCAVTGETAVGAIAANAIGANFDNCGVIGSVTVTSADGCVGGLIGDGDGLAVSNSFYSGTLNGTTKGGIVGLSKAGQYKNLYFLSATGLTFSGKKETTPSSETDVLGKTAAEFSSGEIAHALQGQQTSVIWGQKLKTDKTPVFVSGTSLQVFQVEIIDLDNSNKSTIQYINNGGKVTISAKTGYEIKAYSDAEKKTAFDYKTTTITKSMAIYITSVKAAASNFTVTFDSNGGSAVSSATVESGKTVAKPSNPTKSGHTFEGWYKNSDLTTTWDFSKDTVTANITLYAKWSASTTPTSNVKTGDEGTPTLFYILLGIGIVGAVTAGGILIYRHFKFY